MKRSIRSVLVTDGISLITEIRPSYGKSKLYIPQPLLPREEEEPNQKPLALWERDLG